jgi:lipid II:glycine glycyltransferase (peptidoglycan interpeptide bridge formation enzyme)
MALCESRAVPAATTARPPWRSSAVVHQITDGQTWNRLVQAFPRYDLRAGFEWGQMRAEQGWRTTRFALVDSGECLAACSLQWRRLPGLGALCYAPRGPLFDRDVPHVLPRLLADVRAFARAQGAAFLRASPGATADDTVTLGALAREGFRPLADTWTVWNAPRFVQIIDLTPDEATIRQRLRRRYRQYIANIGRKGLMIEATTRDEDLVAFHGLMANLGRVKTFPVRPLEYYRGLLERYRAVGAAALIVARVDGTLVGGLIEVRFGRRAYVPYSSMRSNIPDALCHGVAPAMFWECIRRAKADGCELLDLGSSGVAAVPAEEHPNYGLYTFKAGLGAQPTLLAPFHDLVWKRPAYALFRYAERRLLPWATTCLARAPRMIRLLRRAI